MYVVEEVLIVVGRVHAPWWGAVLSHGRSCRCFSLNGEQLGQVVLWPPKSGFGTGRPQHTLKVQYNRVVIVNWRIQSRNFVQSSCTVL